jgi:hypothetical protein
MSIFDKFPIIYSIIKIDLLLINIKNIFKLIFKFYIILLNREINWGLGIGDWGLGIGGWGPDPKPQTPTPKPQTPYKKINFY